MLNKEELGRADEPLLRLQEQLSKLTHEAARRPSDPPTASVNTFRPAVSDNRISLRGRVVRGAAGILLAAGIGVAGIMWLGSSGDAAKTAPLQSAPLVQTAPTIAMSPELAPLLQSISRDLTSVGKEIEQLKLGRELIARDNATLSEQLKASQEQLTRVVARLSDELKASQEVVARNNANVAEQIKAIQDHLARINSQASEQNTPPKIATTAPRLPLPPPRPAAPTARKPMPTLVSAPAAAKPKAEKPKLSSASRPSPAR